MTKLTPAKKDTFLLFLSQGNTATYAARAIGMTRQALYKHADNDAEFKKQWENAVEEGIDTLEDEAINRAKDSSDTLLIFMLKGARPDKYRERLEVNVNWRLEVEKSGANPQKILEGMIEQARLQLEQASENDAIEGEYRAMDAITPIGETDSST